jgi:hypothetical protein
MIYDYGDRSPDFYRSSDRSSDKADGEWQVTRVGVEWHLFLVSQF